eukprot:GDKI01047405.1.p1 GENE.GDKI01047405.1~~GDKI01047405.1.p1  ORF type:complete len:221 (-),score=51.45 GDKI01047405.1:133-795(-)
MLVLIMGVCGTGKSTIGQCVANNIPNSAFIDADAYHPMENVNKMKNGIPLTDDDRKEWLAKLAEEIHTQGAWDTCANKCVVLACSALKREYRKVLYAGAWGGDGQPPTTTTGRQCYCFCLVGSFELLHQRLTHRSEMTGHFMPPSLLPSQLATLELPASARVSDCSDNMGMCVRGVSENGGVCEWDVGVCIDVSESVQSIVQQIVGHVRGGAGVCTETFA